jgi:hypothetical protein
MALLTQFIAPIVSLWVIHTAIFSSAAFVNGMRETVVSGRYGRDEISVKHRMQMWKDWRLCIAATIVVCFIFAGIVAAASFTASETLMRWVGGALAIYSFACGVGFIICARGDDELMETAIDSQLAAERGEPAALAR